MMRLSMIFLVILGLMNSVPVAAADQLPWNFNMTPKEVSAVTQYGPYKSFSNGDLETYKAIYDGRERNFQFFFADGKLRRIGVYFYEGQDLKAGAKAWQELYQSIAKRFGAIETPENVAPQAGNTQSEAAFSDKAVTIVQATGKTQMAPLQQPGDAFVFSSLMRREVGGELHYYVVLYFDRRP